MQKWNGSLLRKFDDTIDGNASVGTTIVVRNTVGNTLAVIYDVDDTNSIQKNNPFVTDDFGRYSFFAPNGKYTIEFGDGSDSIDITLVDNITLQGLNGLTEPSDLAQRHRIKTTVAEIATGVFSVWDRLEVTDRDNAPFKMQSGGVVDGFSTISGGTGKTAVVDSLSGNSVYFGVSPSSTSVQNKDAIQAAITFQYTNGVGFLSIPPGIRYGYDRNDPLTFPDMTASTIAFVVTDYSTGDTYTLPSRDGSQSRTFFYTPDQTNGFSDANTVWHRGAWAPAYMLMNDSKLAAVGDPSRASGDNRRSTVFFGNDGIVNWGVGQGTNSSATLTDSQLSSFKIVVNGLPDIGQVGLSTSLTILKTNGNMGFNLSAPTVPFDFATRAGQTSAMRFSCLTSGGISKFITETEYGLSEYQMRSDSIVTTYAGATILQVHKLGNLRGIKGVSGNSFTTANRPSGSDVQGGTMIFDSTLGKPIWKPMTGSGLWVDATGATV